MSILKIPVTASFMPEWVRRCADAVNALINRVTALETFATVPFSVDSVTFRPVMLPASPEQGQTVYDVADDTVKTWNGSVWKAHY